ncbi:MAG TPA: glycosyl hydrolase, partial [Clostridiales bacterium]|nr:glycosyl hydrolase [Clostridiales bacterium]
IKECVVHGIAADDYDAGCQALKAGLDMDMGTSIYKNHLAEAVSRHDLDLTVLDTAVRRVLTVKAWLGLFDNPYVPEELIAQNDSLADSHVALTLEAALKSIVLLKNQNQVLPLAKKTRISLVGSLAGSKDEIIGAWAMSYQNKDCVSILDGLQQAGSDVSWYPCGGPEGELNEDEINQAGQNGDVIVAVVGELVSMSGEAASRANIELPGRQRELLQKLTAFGKPVIGILMNGRPLALSWEAEHLDALIEAWQLGIRMGSAVAQVLFGDFNPQGRLSASFPAVVGQCPVYYNHMKTGRPSSKSKFTSRYIDAPTEALYPFGYGLSYTAFAYSDLTVKESADRLTIRITVKNTGERRGVETAQFYLQDVTGSLVRPVKELKGYAQITLDPSEEQSITFDLLKANMGFYDNNGVYRLEDGEFTIHAGPNSRETLQATCWIKF